MLVDALGKPVVTEKQQFEDFSEFMDALGKQIHASLNPEDVERKISFALIVFDDAEPEAKKAHMVSNTGRDKIYPMLFEYVARDNKVFKAFCRHRRSQRK